MIEELKPYDSYKSPGLRWAEQIPSHWEVDRARSCLQKLNLRSREGREELLTVSSARGVVPRKSATVTMFKAKSYAGYKLCWPDDLVINSLWAWAGGLGVSRHHGIVSSAYGVYRSRPSSKLHPRYLHELVRSAPFNWELQVRSKGIWISRLQLSDDAFLAAPVLVPPLEEQEAIVRFLDHANRRIDQFIRSKKKLIALLNEQKQAIIHRAVTRGLDPDVKLKDSGVPWLGEIPAHWEVRRFRYLLRERLAYGANAAAEFDNPSWPRYIRITDFRSDGTLKPDTFRSLPPSIAADYLVQSGDILLARSGATVGKAFLVRGLESDACHAGYLIRARVNTNLILPEFAFAFTQTPAFGQWKDVTLNTTTIQNIAADKYADLPVPVPPIREQVALLAAAESEVAPIRIAELRLEREIALIREYRTRLVADVVTGLVDVRAAAASLPAIEPEGALVESEGDEPDIDDGEAA